MSINLNSRNNTLCCEVNDLYTALMASELLNDCVDDVVVMLKTYFAFAKEVVDSYFGEAMQNGRLL